MWVSPALPVWSKIWDCFVSFYSTPSNCSWSAWSGHLLVNVHHQFYYLPFIVITTTICLIIHPLLSSPFTPVLSSTLAFTVTTSITSLSSTPHRQRYHHPTARIVTHPSSSTLSPSHRQDWDPPLIVNVITIPPPGLSPTPHRQRYHHPTATIVIHPSSLSLLP